MSSNRLAFGLFRLWHSGNLPGQLDIVGKRAIFSHI